MPTSVSLGAFVLGAVLLLIAVLGGGFKIFGVEVSSKAGNGPRVVSLILGIVLVAAGFKFSNTSGAAVGAQQLATAATPQSLLSQQANKVPEPEKDSLSLSRFSYRAIDDDYKGEIRKQDSGWVEFNVDYPKGRKWQIEAGSKGPRIRLVDADAIMEIDPKENKVYYTETGDPGYPVPQLVYTIFEAS